MKLPDVGGLLGKLGADVTAGGAHLRCEECKRTLPLTSEQAARFFARGWPQCCGYTMTLERRKEVAKASTPK